MTNKASLVERIADLARSKRIDGISDLRDESDRHGMRIVIELSRAGQAQQVLNQLYRFTGMQSSFPVNMLALVDGQPRTLSLKRMLEHYIAFRREVIRRRSQYDLEQGAGAGAHPPGAHEGAPEPRRGHPDDQEARSRRRTPRNG